MDTSTAPTADPAKIDSTAARRLPSRGLRPPASAETAAMAVSVSVSTATHAATAPPLAPCTQQGRLVIPPAPARGHIDQHKARVPVRREGQRRLCVNPSLVFG